MLNITDVNVRDMEHHRRIQEANRHGWLTDPTGTIQPTTKARGVFSAMVSLFNQKRSSQSGEGRLRDGIGSPADVCSRSLV